MNPNKDIAAIVAMLPDYWAARERMNHLTTQIVAGRTMDDEIEQLAITCDEADNVAAAVGRIVAAAVKERSKYREAAPVRAQVIDELELEDWMRYRYERGGCADLCTFEQYKAGYKAMQQQQKKDRRCCE